MKDGSGSLARQRGARRFARGACRRSTLHRRNARACCDRRHRSRQRPGLLQRAPQIRDKLRKRTVARSDSAYHHQIQTIQRNVAFDGSYGLAEAAFRSVANDRVSDFFCDGEAHPPWLSVIATENLQNESRRRRLARLRGHGQKLRALLEPRRALILHDALLSGERFPGRHRLIRRRGACAPSNDDWRQPCGRRR